MGCAIVMDQAVAFTVSLPGGLPITPFQVAWVGYGSLVLNLIAALFVLAFWNGINWVRWAVMIYSVYTIVELANVAGMWVWDHSMAILYVYKAALGIYLLVYLNLRSTRAWFTEHTRINRENSVSRKPNQS